MKYFFAIIIFFAFSCSKNKSCENCTSPPIETSTVIVDGGPVATDGCSFLVKINDSVYYHPDALDISFQHDQLKVKVNYQLTSDIFTCGLGAAHIPVIHINNITKR